MKEGRRGGREERRERGKSTVLRHLQYEGCGGTHNPPFSVKLALIFLENILEIHSKIYDSITLVLIVLTLRSYFAHFFEQQ